MRDAMRAIRRLWPVVLVSVVFSVAVMWASTPADIDTERKVGSYEAIAVLLVEPNPRTAESTTPTPTPRGATARRASPTPSRVTATPTPPPFFATAEPIDPARQVVSRVVLLVRTGEIPHRAARALGREGEDPTGLVAGLRVMSDARDGTVYISMQSKDGDHATEVVNAFARETVRYFETPRPEVVDGRVTLIDEATPLPFEPANEFVLPPDRMTRLGIAALLGLLAGACIAIILHRLDFRIRTAAEVRKIAGLPVIAEIPRTRDNADVALRDRPASDQADAYRIAESTLAALPRSTGRELAVIMVTGATGREPIATTTANLAAAFAEAGSSVLVLEANFRAPSLHLLFDVGPSAGLADLINDPGKTTLNSLVRQTQIPGVRLVTAGSSIDEPAGLVSRLRPVIDEARGSVDYVIVEAPPLLAASESFDLLPAAGAVVVVVGYQTLTRSTGYRLGELLQRFPEPMMGAILTGGPRSRRRTRSRGKAGSPRGARDTLVSRVGVLR